MLNVNNVLTVLKDYIPIEAAIVMMPPDESEQTIHFEFKEILGTEYPLKKLKRFEFYEEVKSLDTCLVIATGERRRFANILLVRGVVKSIEKRRRKSWNQKSKKNGRMEQRVPLKTDT